MLSFSLKIVFTVKVNTLCRINCAFFLLVEPNIIIIRARVLLETQMPQTVPISYDIDAYTVRTSQLVASPEIHPAPKCLKNDSNASGTRELDFTGVFPPTTDIGLHDMGTPVPVTFPVTRRRSLSPQRVLVSQHHRADLSSSISAAWRSQQRLTHLKHERPLNIGERAESAWTGRTMCTQVLGVPDPNITRQQLKGWQLMGKPSESQYFRDMLQRFDVLCTSGVDASVGRNRTRPPKP